MAIATLTVDIEAKLAGIQGDLGKVARLAEQNAKRIENAFSNVGSSIKGAFVGLGATLATGFLTDVIQRVLDAQGALDDLSKSTALSIETLAGLGYAAKVTGGDLDSVAAAVNKLQVNIGKDPEKYRQIGIDAKDGYEALKQLAEIFVAIEDPEQRAAVAAEALGKSWAGTAPLLAEGAAGLDSLVQTGKEASGVTEETAKRAADLGDKLDLLKTRLGGVATRLVNDLVPLLDELVNGFNESAAASSRLSDQGSPLTETLRGLILVGGNVAFVFTQLGTAIGGSAAQIAALANLDLTQFRNIRSALAEDLAKNRTDLDAWEQRIKNAGKLQINQATYSNEGRGRGVGDAPAPPNSESIKRFVGSGTGTGSARGGSGRSGSRAEKAIDDGTRLVEQLRDQIRATQDLSEVEKLELAIADGKYKTATAANLAIARGYAETLDGIQANKIALEEESEAIRQRQAVLAEGARVFESVRTPIEALDANLVSLLSLLDAGAISMETFGRAAAKAGTEMQRLDDKTASSSDELNEFAKSAAQNIQKSLADFLFDPFANGMDGMVKGFGEAIRRMIAEAVAADLAKRLFGDLGGKGGSGQLGGIVGNGISWLADILPSFDVGTSYVPRDMAAIVHKGERIIPAAQAANSQRGNAIVVNLSLTGSSSSAEARRAGAQVGREILNVMSSARRYA